MLLRIVAAEIVLVEIDDRVPIEEPRFLLAARLDAAPNLTSGVYHVEVWADIDTTADTDQVEAKAAIGRGPMVVDEVRFVK